MAANKNLRRNASGYIDITAFYAIRSADRATARAKRRYPYNAKSKGKEHKPINRKENSQ